MVTKFKQRAPLDQGVLADRFRRKYWELKADSERDAPAGAAEAAAIRRLRFNSIIVPLDGARYAEHAIPLAAELAAASQAPMVLESADSLLGTRYDPWLLASTEASSLRRNDKMDAYLREVAGRVTTGAVQATPRLRSVPVSAGALSELARENELIVMAQRPSRFSEPFHLGHSIERLLRCGSAPLIVVRGYRWPYFKRKDMPTKHLLVVLDGTREAELVLPATAAIAESTGAHVTLLRVIPGMPYYGIPNGENETEAKRYLAQFITLLQQRDVRAQSAVWSSNESLGEVILSFAQSCNADLIALTTSLRRTLVGSFRRQPARYLVRHSRIPVLLVSADKTRMPGG